jgi:hypothetical protein
VYILYLKGEKNKLTTTKEAQMNANDIKNNIKIDHNHPGNAEGNPMDDHRLNEKICCNVGDILVAGPQESKVAEIAFLGNAYSLEVRMDSGQKISMKQLCQLVEQGKVSVKQ